MPKKKKLLSEGLLNSGEELEECIRVLRSAPQADKMPSHKHDTEGFLFKRNRRMKWDQSYWKLSANYLEYYKSDNLKKPHKVIHVSFLFVQRLTDQDALLEKQVRMLLDPKAQRCREDEQVPHEGVFYSPKLCANSPNS